MDIKNCSGSIALNYAGNRYVASYEVSLGVLTVRSPFGLAQSALLDGEVASASVARTLLREIVEHPDRWTTQSDNVSA